MTRWGALYDAIERFLEQEKAVRKVLVADYSASRLILEGGELATLETVLNTLKPIHQLTDMLSGWLWILMLFIMVVLHRIMF